ncbi:MAG: DNA/RNA nuclease SfsA [Caldilineae bacterium]|nr:MAG: DNA/RNA nuclease SfsA [Caldilineae bacterium]
MNLPPLQPAVFLRRDNRFRATVLVEGEPTAAHVPNSGRLTDLFEPGRRVWVAAAAAPHRKTPFDLKLVQMPTALVSVDARLPNTLFAEALAAGRLPGFPRAQVEAEVRVGNSRLDFRLSGPEGVCWVETKSVTLVEGDVALFPDVPTLRGNRHLEELIALRRQGQQAAVVFVVQRADARAFAPHEPVAPHFAGRLREAHAAGVRVLALRCRVSLESIEIAGSIETLL